jgi:hypothetical protein
VRLFLSGDVLLYLVKARFIYLVDGRSFILCTVVSWTAQVSFISTHPRLYECGKRDALSEFRCRIAPRRSIRSFSTTPNIRADQTLRELRHQVPQQFVMDQSSNFQALGVADALKIKDIGTFAMCNQLVRRL